ncbi:Poly(A) polymerase [Hesseltinella vesiculosa]|uniref:Poly(A) polymerase n=1 Tax=Hesseltinella vesiculosa TaxID=101127 RepID=A0A1X2GPQ6_9FUNG|nr:Poly(A) polymerase [Hesseltinella vesiculosa]
MSEVKQQWGVSEPISLAYPTPLEVKQTEQLVKTLHDCGLFESDCDAKKRVNVLSKLEKLTKDFVYRVGRKKGLSETVARQAGGRIYTFGSYKLGVHNSGADIDTLCVFPRHVERDDFFTLMRDMLQEHPEVTNLTAVADAYVPVMRFQCSDIPIDFVCARLDMDVIRDDLDLSDNRILTGMDERCVRSINGCRVTDEILRLVPSVDTFRIALRTIKLWADRRGIYSNMMGFLGGVAWAMLVARICQYYPHASASTIVRRFFRIFYQWQWPNPVLLKPIEEGPLEVRVWNPKLYPADKCHRMPIITPVYPSMCATHNVTDSTRTILIAEFKRGAELVETAIIEEHSDWDALFDQNHFFQDYRQYLQIITGSPDSESLRLWQGWVESKVRQLVIKLELTDSVSLAHPYIQGTHKVHYVQNDKEQRDVQHGATLPQRSFLTSDAPSLESLSKDYSDGLTPYYTSYFYIGLVTRSVRPRSPKADTRPSSELTWPTRDFLQLVTSWDSYELNMSIAIRNLKGPLLTVDPQPVSPDKRLKRSQTKDKANGQILASKIENPKKKFRWDGNSPTPPGHTTSSSAESNHDPVSV